MKDVRKQDLIRKMRTLLSDFSRDQTGATAIEYGLIGVLVSVAIIPALIGYRGQFQATYNLLVSTMSSATR